MFTILAAFKKFLKVINQSINQLIFIVAKVTEVTLRGPLIRCV